MNNRKRVVPTAKRMPTARSRSTTSHAEISPELTACSSFVRTLLGGVYGFSVMPGWEVHRLEVTYAPRQTPAQAMPRVLPRHLPQCDIDLQRRRRISGNPWDGVPHRCEHEPPCRRAHFDSCR